MATISTLLQTFYLMTLFLMLANHLVHSQDVTSFTYDTFSENTVGLTYQGGTYVLPGSTFLCLTPADPSGEPKLEHVGRVVYSPPVRFWESSSGRQATFETTINFRIRPSRHGVADGLAFFMAPVNSTIPSGSNGGNLGIFGSSGTTSNLFAVEFDTYVNGAWDPSYRHIGIDMESRMSRNTTRFDSGTIQMVNARITYDANTKIISVVATSGSQTASLSYVFDLKTILPEQVHVGISAATGAIASFHDVISWYFTSSLVYTNVNNDEKPYIRKYLGM